MDWAAVTSVAVVVAAVGAVGAALFAFASWRLERLNFIDNTHYKERLRLEEHYFKVHLLWQELRIAAVMLQYLQPASTSFVPRVDGLPIAQITEHLATKDLLNAEAATRVRVARDDLVQLEELAADGQNAELRRTANFPARFQELVAKTLSSLEQARQAIVTQLPK
jgi:hypothetical protein